MARNLKVVWKIHAKETIDNSLEGGRFCSHNNRFYETEDEAVFACREYLSQSGQTTEGFYVFKTALFVEAQQKPVIITRLDQGWDE